jgi:Flp pilus assembly protein TadD
VIPKAPAAQRTEALHARASLQAELRDWAGAQQTLEQVPPGERKGEVARLQRRVAVQAQAAEAVALARAGQNAQAQWLLTEAETAAGQDPELLGAVAGARMDLGEEVRAGQMIRATLAAQPQAGPGLRLRLAALLLQTRQDTELAGLLQQLSGQSLTAAQRRDFDDLRVGFALRQSDLLREQGDLYNAWEALGPLLQERPREPRLLMALARLHGSAGDDAQARALYETVLQQRPDDVDAWLGLAGAADAQKDHDTARQALAEAQKLAPNTPQVLAQYARHHRAQGQFSQAAEYLRAAVAAEQPARGVQWGQARATTNPFAAYAGRATAQTTMLAGAIRPRTTPLVRPDAAFVDVENLPPTGAGGRPLTDSPIARAQRWRAPEPAPAPAAPVAGTPRFAAAPAAPVAEAAPLPAAPARTASRRRTLADELAEVQNERGRSHAAIGGTITSRTGEAGLGRADLVQTPIEATKVIEEVGQLTVRATPVVITAGRVGADAGSRSRFGTLGLDPAGSASPAEQSDAGVGLSVGLQTRHVSADIGSTPIGFAVVDAVGGVRWRGELDSALRFDVEASRRALTDSVLAFAGTTDTRTGKVWGGVRSTGLRAQLAWEQGDVGFYGYGGAHGLTGREVKTNSRVEVGAGSYWRGRQRADDQLEIGLNLGYQHYRYNLSGYTWGHGGYFSPQHLVALTLPLNWYGRSGRLSWGLQGAAGLQVYREDAAPYFPTDAAAQGTLDSLVAQQKLPASAYAARSEAGAIFNLGGALEYQLTRQLDIGTRLGVEISPQFTQSTGSIYLRFSLEPRAAGGIGLRYPGGPTGY